MPNFTPQSKFYAFKVSLTDAISRQFDVDLFAKRFPFVEISMTRNLYKKYKFRNLYNQ